MTVSATVTNSFERNLVSGAFNLDTDTARLAFYTGAATLDAATTAYSATHEIPAFGSGATGYAAGGVEIPLVITQEGGRTLINTPNDLAFAAVPAGTEFRWALLYDATAPGDNSVAVFDLGPNIPAGGTFGLHMTRQSLGFDMLVLSST